MRINFYLIVISSLILSGCMSVPQRVFYQMNERGRIKYKTMDLLVWENSLKQDENVSDHIVLTGDYCSYHLVQIRKEQEPHIHRFHDVAIFLESGEGIMYIGKESVRIKSGSTVFVEHGTPYHFVNTGASPAEEFVIYSPPYDGTDNVRVEQK